MILVVGDSWVWGTGIDNKDLTWPHVMSKILNKPVTSVGLRAAGNHAISEVVVEQAKKIRPDIIIVGWSGVSRIKRVDNAYHARFRLCYDSDLPSVSKKRSTFFRKNNTQDLADTWASYIRKVNKIQDTKIIHFSVFGDQHLVNTRFPEIMNTSMLEYIAQAQGTNFKYNIPFFEYGFLSKTNIVAEEFCNREFPKHWQRACVEREEIKDTDGFLTCGHPSEKGHTIWAKFMAHHIRSML